MGVVQGERGVPIVRVKTTTLLLLVIFVFDGSPDRKFKLTLYNHFLSNDKLLLMRILMLNGSGFKI